jgi:NAD(P)-dependent dehydrogenase (short-subunit alcohol dehydrogenase family)
MITGGNKGIGLAATRVFLAAGCQVIAIARDFTDLELSTSERLQTVSFDLREEGAIPALVAAGIYRLATDSPAYINGSCIDLNNGAFPR